MIIDLIDQYKDLEYKASQIEDQHHRNNILCSVRLNLSTMLHGHLSEKDMQEMNEEAQVIRDRIYSVMPDVKDRVRPITVDNGND